MARPAPESFRSPAYSCFTNLWIIFSRDHHLFEINLDRYRSSINTEKWLKIFAFFSVMGLSFNGTRPHKIRAQFTRQFMNSVKLKLI